LIYADVRDDAVGVTRIVDGLPVRVPHRDRATEIGDSVWISIETVKTGPDARKELIKERWEYVAARNRYGFNLGCGLTLTQ
jgi:hypothetical protein